MEDAKVFLLDRFQKQGDYGFLPTGVLENMVCKLIELDEAFMQQAGIEAGAEYDDEVAGAFISERMAKEFADHRMYMQRLTDDYLDFNEEYLESIGAIEWD